MGPVRMLVMDVDGTMTDGRLYISAQGELLKTFHVRDGYGICHILPQYNIIPVVITGRESTIVENRCRELGIVHYIQGVRDKAQCLYGIADELEIPLQQAACIGDDENDLPMFELCGVKGCPADAAEAVKMKCDFVCKTCGGGGAVREFIEWLVKGQNSRGNGDSNTGGRLR